MSHAIDRMLTHIHTFTPDKHTFDMRPTLLQKLLQGDSFCALNQDKPWHSDINTLTQKHTNDVSFIDAYDR